MYYCFNFNVDSYNQFCITIVVVVPLYHRVEFFSAGAAIDTHLTSLT
jgi:hypothetical protein